jgi:hypothetical protein
MFVLLGLRLPATTIAALQAPQTEADQPERAARAGKKKMGGTFRRSRFFSCATGDAS